MSRVPRALALIVAAGVATGVFVASPAQAAPPVRTAAQEQCTASTRITDPIPALDLMQSTLAWDETRGEGVTVAVVDSGVNAANPHLRDAVSGGINLVGDGTDPSGLTDTYGHGTAIAGQIAARLIDGSSVEGLAPAARILSVRVFAGVEQQQVEAGLGPSTPRLADGIRWAADQGAQIINVSMSTTQDAAVLRDAVAYATERGSLIIGSSGNRDSTLAVEENDTDGERYPAGIPGVLGVAAADLGGVVTDASIHGPHVAVSALGQNIMTTSFVGGDCAYAGDTPATSFAAAYVSAAAALVASAHPNETPAQWAYRLEATAVRADPDARDDTSGWGIVQPYEAIALIPGSGIRGPASPFVDAPSDEATPVAAAPVRVTNEPALDAEATIMGFSIGLGALILLAAAGAIGVFIARRRGERTASSAPVGRGLYRDEETRAG
ncbi:S8 family serine peptidase [Microbacterium sp. cx-55]|uniref:S8 family serine peptidase n=1 Tax=unclassified Microbacterium TaxID=2609290 RepID=UPI001CC0F3FA|nr:MULTISPECIES: S8 family serine peptidase [unclassified Microbacterium]MBZ4488305.1 S8 family serine peptidase [Microbacterium sp. cx-55]MCC4909364.1 S8 family serine peptidase [Microbacterium sp. cx-59]UGB34964.1 S8 family serine peptidase [Microbacterium sp. cx-55]